MDIHLNPIGYVQSPVKEPQRAEWGKIRSKIVIDPELAPGLKGLDEFSHVVVITYLHQATDQAKFQLTRRPRGREDLPLVGFFATRAPYRPNPIGITIAKLIKIEGNILELEGLDMIDGTPVLDLKAQMPRFYQDQDAKFAPWVEKLDK